MKSSIMGSVCFMAFLVAASIAVNREIPPSERWFSGLLAVFWLVASIVYFIEI